jgi:hypothetical protein
MTFLSLLSDALLLTATLGLAIYCRSLTRRLRAFHDVENGLGGTISSLSSQVDQLKAALDAAARIGDTRGAEIDAACARADDRIGRLELLLAAAEDSEALDERPSHVEEAAVTFRPARGRAMGAGR